MLPDTPFCSFRRINPVCHANIRDDVNVKIQYFVCVVTVNQCKHRYLCL